MTKLMALLPTSKYSATVLVSNSLEKARYDYALYKAAKKRWTYNNTVVACKLQCANAIERCSFSIKYMHVQKLSLSLSLTCQWVV